MFDIHLQLKAYVAVTGRKNGRSLGAFQNTCSSRNRVATRTVLSLLEIGFGGLNFFSLRIRCVSYLQINDTLHEI
jgi:hypothetical protein